MSENVFDKFFSEQSSGLLKWTEPITVGLDIFDYVQDKHGNFYYVVEAHFENGERKRMNTYGFKSMITQFTNIFGSAEAAVGNQVMVKYHGKKPLPDDATKSYHSCYVEDLNPQ